MSGNGISWATCKSAPCSRQITDRMPFLPPNQQCQGTGGTQPTTKSEKKKNWKVKTDMLRSIGKQSGNPWSQSDRHVCVSDLHRISAWQRSGWRLNMRAAGRYSNAFPILVPAHSAVKTVQQDPNEGNSRVAECWTHSVPRHDFRHFRSSEQQANWTNRRDFLLVYNNDVRSRWNSVVAL